MPNPVSDFFDYYLFPEDVNWDQVYASVPPNHIYPRVYHLWLGVVCGVILTIVRAILQRWIFVPLATRVLPQTANKSRAVSVEALTPAQQKQPKKRLISKRALSKFLESCWRCLIYATMTMYGFVVLYHKDFAWDLRLCWIKYPDLYVSYDIVLYYMISLGLYLHLLVALFYEHRKKDFWEMLVHHIATIFLICFSWYCNFVRIGTLVLIAHDVSDPLMELAKLFNYARIQRICDFFFVLFTIVFGVSRLYYFPFHVISNTYFDAIILVNRKYHGYFAVYFFNAFLITLQVLHFYWYFLILRMAYKFVVVGKVAKDDRESDDSPDEKED